MLSPSLSNLEEYVMDSIFKGECSLIDFKVPPELKEQSSSFVFHALTPKAFMEHIKCVFACAWMCICGCVGVHACVSVCVCMCMFWDGDRYNMRSFGKAKWWVYQDASFNSVPLIVFVWKSNLCIKSYNKVKLNKDTTGCKISFSKPLVCYHPLIIQFILLSKYCGNIFLG